MSLGVHRNPLRRAGIVLLAVVLVVLAAGLTIAATTGGRSASAPSRVSERVTGAPAPGPLSDAPHALPPAAAGAARAFLLGYLAYVDGQVSSEQIPDAAPQVIAGLGVKRLPASRASAKARPAVLSLGAREANGSVLHVTGLISDGISRYPVRTVMVHQQGGWVTSRLEGAE